MFRHKGLALLREDRMPVPLLLMHLYQGQMQMHLLLSHLHETLMP
jgi:hypothetical protein